MNGPAHRAAGLAAALASAFAAASGGREAIAERAHGEAEEGDGAPALVGEMREAESFAGDDARPDGAERPDDGADDPAGDRESARAALGVSPGWLRRNDYGDRSRNAFAPELIAFAYAPGPGGDLYWRPGARIGYAGLSPADSPSSLTYRERDAIVAAELGAVRDGLLVPAVTAGAGVHLRRLQLEVGEPVGAEEEPISRWEFLPKLYGQAAVGVPLGGTGLLIEPYARFELVRSDSRARWRWGADISIGL